MKYPGRPDPHEPAYRLSLPQLDSVPWDAVAAPILPLNLEFPMKILSLALMSLLVASVAFAADPNWSRTLQWPFTGDEFSLTPPQGGCVVEAGCFRVVNDTAYWMSPGIDGNARAQPGSALVVDAEGIVYGVYVGEYTLASAQPYVDPDFPKGIPVINGDFRPAIRPQTDPRSPPTTYLTVNPGVTTLTADAIQFRPDAKAQFAFDVGLGRVVNYVPGHGLVVKRCSVYNDVTDPAGSPQLAMFTNGECH